MDGRAKIETETERVTICMCVQSRRRVYKKKLRGKLSSGQDQMPKNKSALRPGLITDGYILVAGKDRRTGVN